ncbi:RluA family pseudouridine synthase [Acetobacter sp. TBRC 12305]|uniref:Pseudouridine synthase n=1 Tax=Acetobacter garciniae TaxID=2817435 RepID=A0A939HP38_9PROT|nr:RluA family pseudouridine synthase [Acetobacter garciniae]MBO1325439.1 RluA family pseudouridine synthase [Acetobacter garciniae]MBX0345389.1 RluA family pseudouridine synthase [Acetobacter garciniae]
MEPASQPCEQPGALVFTVAQDQAGERVDRYLAENVAHAVAASQLQAQPRFQALSRSRIKGLIEAGHLLCNGQTLREPAAPVRGGMQLVLDVPQPAPATPEGEAMAFAVLYEDDDLIVLDKPAGLVVHPAPGNETGTLVNGLIAHCGASLQGIGGERRPGIVHRLDKDTSGVMVVAKTELAHLALSEDFAQRRIDRCYLAFAWGLPAPAQGEYEGAIGRDKRDRKRMALTPRGGKWALTRYRTLECFGSAAALVECRLATGRTHQIRVHFSTNGHPLIGDPLYLRRIPAAAKGLGAEARAQALDFSRQALHAARLGFTHPRTGENLLFETPMPADMQALRAALSADRSGA